MPKPPAAPPPPPKRKRYPRDVESNFTQFGKRLRAARNAVAARRGERYGMVQLGRDVQLRLLETPVKHTGAGRQSIRSWERNLDRPRLETIIVLAEVLGVDPGWLAFGKWSHAPAPPFVAVLWPDTHEPVDERAIRNRPRTDGALRVGEYPHMIRDPAPVKPPATLPPTRAARREPKVTRRKGKRA